MDSRDNPTYLRFGKANEELDKFIDGRAQKRQAVRAREEGWKESVREHHERRREENRWEWVRYFDMMAANHMKTSERYAERAQALLDMNHAERSKG